MRTRTQWGWYAYWSKLKEPGTRPFLLVVSSALDEAWQLLHHVRTFANPLAPKFGLLSFIVATRSEQRARNIEVARIQGVDLFRDQSVFKKLIVLALYAFLIVFGASLWYTLNQMYATRNLVANVLSTGGDLSIEQMTTLRQFARDSPFSARRSAILENLNILAEQSATKESKDVARAKLTEALRGGVDEYYYYFLSPSFGIGAAFTLVCIWFIVISFLTFFFGRSFYSVAFAPFRSCFQLSRAVGAIFNDVAIYIVRVRSWSFLQELALGLEGYRFRLPQPTQMFAMADPTISRYQEISKQAEQRALEKRGDWVKTHLGDVSQAFSKLAVTSADLASLLATVETDMSLVHAAYHMDDECIETVADWIAGSRRLG
jgi:hypothetical protein